MMSEIFICNYPILVAWDKGWFEYILETIVISAEAQLE